MPGGRESVGRREGKGEMGRGCRLPKSTLSLRGERERESDAPSTCHKKQEDEAGINRLIDQGRPEIGTGLVQTSQKGWLIERF